MTNLRESDIVLIETLGYRLAHSSSVEGIARELRRVLRKIARSTEVRLVVADRSGGWREWVSGDGTSSVRTCNRFPKPPSSGTTMPFDSANLEEGLLWISGSSEREMLTLRIIAPHVATAVSSLTALGRAQRDVRRERRLAQDRFRSRDEERRRIALELHDDLGQSLASLKINLKWIEDAIRDKEGMTEASNELAQARETTGALLAKVRDLSHTLYPSILQTLGLTAALKELVHQSTRRSSIESSCESIGKEKDVPKEVAEGLYRCCQEAISNVVRHSAASRVTVEIRYSSSEVRLTVEDNGKGFEPARLRDRDHGMMSSGFWTIRQRVAGLGGEFRVSTAAKRGVTLEITIPNKVRSFDGRQKNKAARR